MNYTCFFAPQNSVDESALFIENVPMKNPDPNQINK